MTAVWREEMGRFCLRDGKETMWNAGTAGRRRRRGRRRKRSRRRERERRREEEEEWEVEEDE